MFDFTRKKIRKDFSFMFEFGFREILYGKINKSSVTFKRDKIEFTIGYNIRKEFYVFLRNDNKRLHYDKETLDDLAKTNPRGYEASKNGFKFVEYPLARATINGKSYKEQAPQVKEIILKKLQELNIERNVK